MTPVEHTARSAGQPIGLVGGRPRSVERGVGSRAADAPPADEPVSKRMLLSVIVPAYNEQDNVLQMFARLTQALERLELEWEVIFSVDPCTDRTEELIRRSVTRIHG